MTRPPLFQEAPPPGRRSGLGLPILVFVLVFVCAMVAPMLIPR